MSDLTGAPPRASSRPLAAVALVVGLIVGLVAGSLAAVAGIGPGGSAAAPRLSALETTGTTLVNEYFELLKTKDAAGLEAFLSPAFTLVRADGSRTGKDEYIAKGLPTITDFTLSGVSVTQAAGVLVVSYTADVAGVTNGKPYTPGPAPRLSTFAWEDGAWRLAAHANFNPLTGTAATPDGTPFTLAFQGTSDPAENRFHKVADGAVQYGTGRIAGTGTLGSTPVQAEVLVALDYRDGDGGFNGYITLTFPNGDLLGFSYSGKAEADGEASTIDGAMTAIGGTGTLGAVTGTGHLTGRRNGPVGSPVDYRIELSLVGMPAN